MKRILLKTESKLFVVLFFLFSLIVNAATITISSTVTYSSVTHADNDIVVANGATFTINSNAQINTITVNTGGTLIVNSPYTLTVGIISNAYALKVVDFQNGSFVTVNSGSAFVVYGLLENSNNSTGVVFNGTVSVFGNVTGGGGSAITGSGTLDTAGSIITSDNGQAATIFGSTADCTTGPCSSSTSCPSFTGSISGNQTICSGAIPSPLTSSISPASSPTYQWQSSTTSGIGFTDIVTNGTNSTYVFPSGLSQTTYYRLKIKSTCTLVTPQVVITVNPLPVAAGTISGTSTVCQGQSGVSYSIPAITNATSYIWSYSGTGFTPLGTTASITGSFSSSATSGNLTVIGVNACGNGTVSATYPITVNPLPALPTLSVPTQPACSVATGSFTITNYNAAYTYVVSPSTGVTIAGDIITAPAGGPYTVTSTLGGCTSAASLGVTLVPPGTPATPTTPTIDPASIVFPTINGNDGSVTLKDLPAGNWELTQTFVDASGTTTKTITGSGIITTLTGLSAGSYSFEVVSITGPCISPRSSTTPALIVVPYTPLVSAATAINCTGFTANWPATPTATEYLLDVSTVSNFATFVPGYKDVKVVNALTFTVTGMPSGTWYYRIRAKNATAISLYSATITVTPLTNTYSAGSWSAGTPPTSGGTQNIEFDDDYNSTGDISGCSCTVTSGKVVIKSGHTLTITNGVTSNGQLIFEDNASLVQTTNATNTGAIEYQRTSKPMKNFDYTYWSSPVKDQNIVALSPNTLADKYFRYNGSVDNWEFYNGTMVPGVGYIIRVPKPNFWPNPAAPTWEQPVAFIGVPNNGDYSFSAGAGEFNLIGNPYPSAIDADLFIDVNKGIINGALYFWTHNTAITNNEYTADDYATYNITGGTGTGTGGNLVPEWVDANSNQIVDPGEYTELNGNGFLDKLPEWNDLNSNNRLDSGEWTDVNNNNKLDLPTFEVTSKRPLGKIAAGQSFFVENAAAGAYLFTNAMRNTPKVLDPNSNTQFFKQTNTKKTATVEKNRVWLNLTNSGGAFKQLLVGYITGATNDWDNLYDGPSFDGQEFVDFYSINQGQNLTIQGRALPFEVTDEVPLGYRSTLAGQFDISIDNRDGVLANQFIWLEDKKTNTLHELTKDKYTFTAINGVENDRFVLKYINPNKNLGTDDKEITDNSLVVSVKNKKITLASSAEAIIQVQVFDLLGRKIYNKSKINAQEYVIEALPSSEQTLIVKTTLANGAISNKKIIY